MGKDETDFEIDRIQLIVEVLHLTIHKMMLEEV